MDYLGEWAALIMASLALIIAGVNYVRTQRLRNRVEYQLRALAQRESWQRRSA